MTTKKTKYTLKINSWVKSRKIYKAPDKLFLTRYYILNTRCLKIFIHKFHASDFPIPHCHPYNFFSMVLKGQYTEHFVDGTNIIRKRFRPVFRTAREFHWIEKNTNTIWTLFITGRRKRMWGFLPEFKWVDEARYHEMIGTKELNDIGKERFDGEY